MRRRAGTRPAPLLPAEIKMLELCRTQPGLRDVMVDIERQIHPQPLSDALREGGFRISDWFRARLSEPAELPPGA